MTPTTFTRVVLTIIIATMTTTPLSARVIHVSFEESSGAGSGDTDVKTELDIDLGELAVEYFQNGTQKKESSETLIDIYQKIQNKNMSELHTDSTCKEHVEQYSEMTNVCPWTIQTAIRTVLWGILIAAAQQHLLDHTMQSLLLIVSIIQLQIHGNRTLICGGEGHAILVEYE